MTGFQVSPWNRGQRCRPKMQGVGRQARGVHPDDPRTRGTSWMTTQGARPSGRRGAGWGEGHLCDGLADACRGPRGR